MENRRSYDKDFKERAVRLYKESDKSMKEIEEDLNITKGNLGRWVREYSKDKDDTFSGNGRTSAKNLEIERLKRENKILREERDILKKSLGIFSNHER